MQSNVKFNALFCVETIQSPYDVVFFKKDYFFAEHGQTKGCGKTGQTGSDDGDVVVIACLAGRDSRQPRWIEWIGGGGEP